MESKETMKTRYVNSINIINKSNNLHLILATCFLQVLWRFLTEILTHASDCIGKVFIPGQFSNVNKEFLLINMIQSLGDGQKTSTVEMPFREYETFQGVQRVPNILV